MVRLFLRLLRPILSLLFRNRSVRPPAPDDGALDMRERNRLRESRQVVFAHLSSSLKTGGEIDPRFDEILAALTPTN